MQICCRGLLCICEAPCWGGDVMYILVLDAVSLYHRDIFSVAKDKNQTDLPEAELATIYVHGGFKLDLES
jgi:hypothetical protein